MSSKKKLYTIFLIGVSVVFFGTPSAFPITVGDIAQELTCPCGCSMLVSVCEGAMQCSAAEEIKNQILAKLDRGQSKEEIIAFFLSQYGEQILSSPTKQGFNLTAWVLPFAAVIFGTGALYALLKRWASRKKPGQPVPEPVPFKQKDKIYLEKIEEELRTFES
jgi:cytochrome c-type biogenesis protein CcmH